MKKILIFIAGTSASAGFLCGIPSLAATLRPSVLEAYAWGFGAILGAVLVLGGWALWSLASRLR
ncbi:hypothetical protein A2716_00625 [candidate division WWE3 bacterium RIFCSPHIGHO2_01_FULL_40_23]|uniref:Uncharacterized protein n=1 Tax=candidate division WWE3 bacterium RIFCSPLOWO2_01_FULL_41_18 TaxID=1802625 RepID=A0A1F4VEV2_UNCKA|nr:MAG: hypothetical protein A2716_00625 [candidate division WWE3 bacterium RIFCSPHIGHO2_01_FULL_40_23]OGC55498.1 MAG: hypothetical protein A3A78_00895 [candidate division WWE3 bacterium RIFCSPLOWO2_01_FULL_41_18]